MRPDPAALVARICAEAPGLQHIMPIATQPIGQPGAGAAVDQEVHEAATEIADRVSPAMTAWA